jgi:hypothetical protein
VYNGQAAGGIKEQSIRLDILNDEHSQRLGHYLGFLSGQRRRVIQDEPVEP